MFASPLKTCPQSPATAGEPVDHPEPLEQLEGQPQRQAHHPEEVATDPLDQRRALALDRVGAGLVQRLPGRDVRGDLGFRKRSECHVGHVERMLHPPILRHRHRGHDLMLPPLELPQHLGRLLGVRRFPENRAPQHHRRVGREHDGPALAPGHGGRLFARQPRHVALGLLCRPEALIHFGRHHANLEPDHLEQLASARGSARQDDHFSRIRVTGPSFTSSTSIIAPNSPVSTRVPLPAPRSLRRETNRSYNGTASSGGAASMKLGRRPFCTSPYSVNWDTTNTAPCTSASARFILPSASPNTRRPSSLSAIQASVSPVSEGANPARTRNPTPIFPVTLPLTRTSARETRCRTTLTAPAPTLMRSAECGMRNCRAEVDPASSLRGSTVARSIPHSAFRIPHSIHSTVTLFARLRGWSTLQPRRTAM